MFETSKYKQHIWKLQPFIKILSEAFLSQKCLILDLIYCRCVHNISESIHKCFKIITDHILNSGLVLEYFKSVVFLYLLNLRI